MPALRGSVSRIYPISKKTSRRIRDVFVSLLGAKESNLYIQIQSLLSCH